MLSASSLAKLSGHQPHLVRVGPLRLWLGLQPILLRRLARRLLLHEALVLLLSEFVFEL